MVSFFLGLDTSCYTTSLGVVDAKGKPVLDLRKPLAVREGEKGLRQSEAFFQHVKNLPLFFHNKDFCRLIPGIKAVSASEKPRPGGNSYMPVFKAGESIGKVAAGAMLAAYYPSTHQEGHILAGLISAGVVWENFWAFHLSGGTTELLAVEIKGAAITINKIGGSSDIAAGQFIDRIGVKYGLGFPAGPKLEALARAAKGSCSLPVAVKGNSVSFSGPLTQAERLAGYEPAEVA
ncbi:MAG TPA: O-sialoglycoprotein endopeptidase, partial [Firmicutes bacterium]|nr:O-sialoglycoprotein endopeptidase [Bacillota bacterium]